METSNEILLRRGIVIIDNNEKVNDLRKYADHRMALSVPNPDDPAHPRSLDFMVITKAGQVVTAERKSTRDAINSMEKIERQAAVATCLVCEWNVAPLRLTEDWEDPKFRLLVENVEKRMWRLAFRQPVIFTHDVEGTIRFLSYLKGKKEPVDIRHAIDPMRPYICGIGGESFPTRQGLFDHKCSAASP